MKKNDNYEEKEIYMLHASKDIRAKESTKKNHSKLKTIITRRYSSRESKINVECLVPDMAPIDVLDPSTFTTYPEGKYNMIQRNLYHRMFE